MHQSPKPFVLSSVAMGLAGAIKEAGIVGAGGAGFPTHVKAASSVDTIIANGAECEPLLMTDQSIMASHPRELLEALSAEAEAVGARRVVLATKAKYQGPIDALRRELCDFPRVELFLLDDTYPSGDEQFLVHEVTGRIVPEGGIPLHVGALVQNVGTLLNIHDAMTSGKPVIDKHITVAGHVRRPGVYIARVGTPLAHVLAHAGGTTLSEFAVIEGGPMMGQLVRDLLAPVTKTTSGYIVLPRWHPLLQRKAASKSTVFKRALAACCQCRQCTDMCPRALLGHRIRPHLAMRAVHAGTEDGVLEMGSLCCLCGVCEMYACPMGLSPRAVLQDFRARAAAAKLRNPFDARPEKALDAQKWTRVPKARLTARLGLSDVPVAPLARPIVVPPPQAVKLRLKQHVGAPSMPVVTVGARVKAGDLVAEVPEGALGARVHASIDGTVRSIGRDEVVIERG